MYLNKVTVKNVKAITDMELSFTPGVNLLIGDNGTGKSSMLEAIGVAISGILKVFLVFQQKESVRMIFILKQVGRVMLQQKYLMVYQENNMVMPITMLSAGYQSLSFYSKKTPTSKVGDELRLLPA